MILSNLLDFQDGMPLSTLRMVRLKKSIIKLLNQNESTIAELCRETEFSVPTITKVLGELIKDGIVVERGKIDTPGGRRPSIYAINPNSAFFMGVNVKRDSVSMGIQNFTNEFIKLETQIPYRLENTRESLQELCGMINLFIEQSGVDKEKILGACVVFTGRINSQKGINTTYFYFDEAPLSEIIESLTGIRTFIENDSRAMLYGEYCSGAVASHEKDVIYLNISWGFGIGILCNGDLYYGKSGYSGEFGHSPILNNEIICECGKKGCIQTEMSGQTLIRRFKEKLMEGSTSVLTQTKSLEEITMYDIIDAAVQNEDLLAIEVIEEVGEKLGHYLSLLVNVFNPDMVIIGGDLATAGQYIRLPIETALYKYSLNILIQDLAIKVAGLGDKAAVVGACYILQGRLFNMN